MTQVSSVRLPAGVHLIDCRVDSTPNWLPVFWGEWPVLVDTGLKDDPESVIVPTLRSLGQDPARIAIILNSHVDGDHTGGNAGMLRWCPTARIACGAEDRPLIESAQAEWEQRWNHLAADHGISFPDSLREGMSPGTRVDWILRDGDVLRLGLGRWLRVVATPGHSFGHLSFLLLPQRVLFCGDSVQGVGIPAGRHWFPPRYFDPEVYWRTLSRIALCRAKMLVTCHLGGFRRGAIRALLVASRRMVMQIYALVRRLLRSNPSGLTLRELTYRVSRAVDRWEERDDIWFAPTVNGHLQHALRQNRAGPIGDERPLRFIGV